MRTLRFYRIRHGSERTLLLHILGDSKRGGATGGKDNLNITSVVRIDAKKQRVVCHVAHLKELKHTATLHIIGPY